MNANSAQEWDRIWSDPAQAEWRADAMAAVYDRIVELVPKGASVVDLGGGVGTLARRLGGVVWDHSAEAVRQAPEGSRVVDLESDWRCQFGRGPGAVVATECLEHLTAPARARIYRRLASRDGLIAIAEYPGDPVNVSWSGLFSVPNNRLGPDEEPQHTIKWTAIEFLTELRQHFDHCRVEVIGGYLLGVCGSIARKSFSLSVCTPARDEGPDIERTLASFRGVADQLVVGVDPRSKDRTEEIARQYADEVFILDSPKGPDGDEAPAVHFSHIRNQCIDKCTGDWVFMTEAHESLHSGQDQLLQLQLLPDGARVAFVMRTGDGQRWAFPWLHINHPKVRYRRATHNELDFPVKWQCVRLPQVQTLHKRSANTIERRRAQRKVQNRKTLTEDWIVNKNDSSLMYLGSEWSEYNKDKAIQRLQEFLALNRSNGSKRYHARLQCAKLLAQQGDVKEARSVLINATAEDWSRIDHWFYLGDLLMEDERYEEALQFYKYAAVRIENPPFCVWWVDTKIYGYLTAERLTECHAALGQFEDSLKWAFEVVRLMPNDTPESAIIEAKENIDRIQEKINSKFHKEVIEHVAS